MAGYPGKQGRKALPTQLKIVRGTLRKHRVNPDEPIPPVGPAKPPRWISKAGRKHWKELAGVLTEMGVLTPADVGALALLADSLAEYTQAEREGAVSRMQEARRFARTMYAEFGLTPSSRSRVKATPPAKEKSALEKLRDRGRQA